MAEQPSIRKRRYWILLVPVILIFILCGGWYAISVLSYFVPLPTNEPMITAHYDDVNAGARDRVMDRICSDKRDVLTTAVEESLQAVESAGQPLAVRLGQTTNFERAFLPSYGPVVSTYHGFVTLPDGSTRHDILDLRCALDGCCIEHIEINVP